MSTASTSGRPAVSIIVPVFNGASFLRECLDSIVAQTWRPLEIVVMDDASTDATAEIANSYGDLLTYVRQPVNRGQFRNVEDGLARVSGKYIGVFHADDRYDATIVEEEVAVLERDARVGLVFVLDRFMDSHGREYGRLQLPPALRGSGSLDHARVLHGVLEYKNVFMPTPGALVRAELYRRVGPFRTEFGSAADLDMWLRLARLADVALLERHLFSYRHTPTSEGQGYQRLRTEPEVFFALMERQLEESPEVSIDATVRAAFEAHRAVDALRVAVNAYLVGDLTRSRAALARATLRTLVASGRVDRPRHVLLRGLLGALTRLPRSRYVARALHWRYYGRLPWWESAA